MRVLHAYRSGPSELSGHQGLDELPTLVALCRCCHTPLLEELSLPHVTTMRRDILKLTPGFSWMFPMHHSPFPTSIYIFSL